MLKLLFIEDDKDAVASAMEHFASKGAKCQLFDFNAADKGLAELEPDVVVLDVLMGAPADQKAPGVEVFDRIWNKRFCPVVVYSAQPEAILDNVKHPFVHGVKKGSKSVAELEAKITELEPIVAAVRDAELPIKKAFSLAMRDVAPDAFTYEKDAKKRSDIVLRAGRRRIAALMDENQDDVLAHWEHYICPPISTDLLLGDILQEVGGDASKAESFRLVLTPSCDLVASSGRKPKVKDVLVARCVSMKDGLNVYQLKKEEMAEKLPKYLSQGSHQGMLPIPALTGRIPTMAANLRRLELIPFDSLAGKFKPIASMDSPFRELVAWAYLQIGCRPATPDRDVNTWTAEIISTCFPGEAKK